MIKVIERKHSIQVVGSRADWPFIKWCLEEGMMCYMETDPKDATTSPDGGGDSFRAWKRNGMPCTVAQLPQEDKS
tara:strand:- start:776 stop:1000 length:225 start_codon:yes stop_codon:yes gene_type:complete